MEIYMIWLILALALSDSLVHFLLRCFQMIETNQIERQLGEHNYLVGVKIT